MIQFILAALGGYFIGDSLNGATKMADGGGIKGVGFDQNGNPYGFDDEMDSVYEWHYKEGDKVYKVWDKIDGVYVKTIVVTKK